MATSTRPGDVLAGRYRLVDLLAESGGGRFWRAQDTMLERYVALHVLAEDDPRAEDLLAAARDSATFHDARVLRVLDAATTDGLSYVVNEWGTGTSLDILLARGEPLGPRRSSWLVAEVASAIAVAHHHGVTHGRLNPENVLIDRFGAVRIIGLGMDAALHGIPRGDRAMDRSDLAGLLHCCLTGTWPGPSDSHVPAAPRENGSPLPPRRVRAGVPRALDDIWREIMVSPHRGRGIVHHPVEVGSAHAIRDRLLEFIGDPAGLPQALASSIPAINELQPVDLPSVRDPRPRGEADRGAPPAEPPTTAIPTPPVEPEPAEAEATDAASADEEPTQQVPLPTDDAGDDGDQQTQETAAVAPLGPGDPGDPDNTGGADHTPDPADDTAARAADPDEGLPPNVSVSDLPTEAGMPVFDDDTDDVDWFRAASTPPPPPPELKDPEPPPLFAPDPEEGQPVRRPREGVSQPRRAQFDPTPPSSPAPPPPANPWESDFTDTAEQPTVPGRNWFRLAMALVAALLLLVAVVVAFNLGRGRTPLGAEPDDTTPTPTPTEAPAEVTGLTAVDFDPFGNPPEEHPDTIDRTVDGDAGTTWRTMTYLQQFGPEGLKPGVGLVVDLGESVEVAEVEVTVVGGATDMELYVGDDPPSDAPQGEPAATGTAEQSTVILEPEDATGQYALIWLTSLPEVPGGFRGEVAEVVVRGR
ncbi:protein kinase family protein [Nocardioides panacisoli]|uniref:protein kinase family protein n=1 Tax=Nocardioides panacisoli TaxID=627624 RepID=UPI001C63876D|nr:protein kinase family protein [Nocardioides panacisoli]QYJ03295.1 protein kinase family protein [Nocardioides panacisoli]